MNRLFGKAKPKTPGPSINDCIAGVSVFDIKIHDPPIIQCFHLLFVNIKIVCLI